MRTVGEHEAAIGVANEARRDAPAPSGGAREAAAGVARLFEGPGEMRERCRIHDWAATPLGRVESWPPSLRTIVSTALAMGFPAIVLWGPELVQLYNDPYIPFLGVKHPAALGMPSRLCWPEVWHLVEPVIARVLTGETVTLADQHYPLLRLGAGLPPDDVYISLSSLPLRDEAGSVGGVLVTCIDTTAQVRAQRLEVERQRLMEETARSERRAASVLERMADAYATLDSEFRFQVLNSAAERALERSREELCGRTLWETFPAALGSEVERQYRRVQSEGLEAHFIQHYVGDGFDVHLDIDAYPTAEGGIALFWRDISDRVTAEAFQREMAAHIARYNAELSANAEAREQTNAALETRVVERTAELARANMALVAEIAERTRVEEGRNALRLQLALAEEGERRRLSRELHDQLGQHLTAMTLGLDAVSAVVPVESPIHARLASLRELAAALMRDVRSLAVTLRPPELDDVGLESAAATYVSQWSARYNVATEIAISGLGDYGVPDAAGSALYRILQEALTNVARHAAARQVSVILDQANGAVRLIVEDDGRGFDVDSTPPHAVSERRLGLAGMRERAALAGGTLTVESALGSGTTIYVRIPIERGGNPAMSAASPAARSDTGSPP